MRLGEAALAALRQVREEQQEAQRLLGDGYARDLDLVFAQPDGKPLHPRNITQRDFRRIIGRVKLPMIRFHDLRHLYASHSAFAGVPLKATQAQLGHATPTFTARVYQHVLADQQAQAAAAVEAHLLGRDELRAEPQAFLAEPDQARTERIG